MDGQFRARAIQGKNRKSAAPLPHPQAGEISRPLFAGILQRPGTWLAVSALLVVVASASLFFFRDRIFTNSEHVVLSLWGSTALGDELMPKLAAAFLRDEMGAVQTGSRVIARDAQGHSRVHVWGRVPGMAGLQVLEINALGSSAAFSCLAVESGPNSCDIGMASRPIDDLDKQSWPALRNLGNRATEHVVALDGIAIIVNPTNPVAQLSIPQLRAIYTGQITNWKAVGGHDAPIVLYGRDRDSGTFAVFDEKVMGEKRGKEGVATSESSVVPTDHRVGDSELMVDLVMRSPNAIGYVTHPMIRQAKALPISDGSGPAIPPTELMVMTEEYPICRQLLLYHWDAPGSLVDAFVRYVVSKPGQDLVVPSPFVELPPKVFPVIPPENAPAAYKQIASNYLRISLSFRFSAEQTGASANPNRQFNNLANLNVLRLRAYLAQQDGTGNDILLIGFTDRQEATSRNQNLARMRAESVASSLRAIGVIVPSENIRGFGAELPAGSNETPEGRRKNRRVEVWIRKGLQ
jgi:phosphate transport system substrate-binding protein